MSKGIQSEVWWSLSISTRLNALLMTHLRLNIISLGKKHPTIFDISERVQYAVIRSYKLSDEGQRLRFRDKSFLNKYGIVLTEADAMKFVCHTNCWVIMRG